MKHFVATLVFASLVLLPAIALADPPGVVTLKDIVIKGNPRRPIVTVEISRAKIDVPLHAMKHPLDTPNPGNAAPF
jgi:hypothetical protein